MKKNQKNKSVFEILSFLKKGIKENSLESTDTSVYLEAIEELNIAFKGLRNLTLILMVALVGSVVIIFINDIYGEKVQDFNNKVEDLRGDSLVRKILEIKSIKKSDTITTTDYTYYLQNNKLVTYPQLKKENDSLLNKIAKLNSNISDIESEVQLLKDKIGLAEKYYEVKFYDKGKYIEIEGKKIDSGLLLLNHFREKLYYDEKSKSWKIKE